MNPRNWNRRFRRGKAYPVSRSGNGGGCLPPGHLPSSGPPAPLYPGAGRMPGASDPGRALRSPSGTPFPPPSRSAGSHMQDGAVSPPGRIAGAISCRALPFLAPCRFSLAGGADCHGEGFRENVQAIRHRHLPLYGIQFHPESILTPDGEALLRNFLSLPAGSREKRRIK